MFVLQSEQLLTLFPTFKKTILKSVFHSTFLSAEYPRPDRIFLIVSLRTAKWLQTALRGVRLPLPAPIKEVNFTSISKISGDYGKTVSSLFLEVRV